VTPIVLLADEGWTITTRPQASRAGDSWSRGQHGYDHELSSMGAVLVGAGPGIAPGVTVRPLHNVHVYPLLAALLGVTPARTDGSLDSVRAMLRPR
jgi:predicted AlkP superfamily pyrophosphatase or phosphodiesterase